MSIDKKVAIVIILLLLSSFSGCMLFKTEFSLISSVVYDDDGFASLLISFNTTDKTTLKLFDPNDNIIFSDIYYRGINDAVPHLEEYRKTPPSGTYNLKAYDKDDNVIFKNQFFFNGQNLSITKVAEEWWLEDNKYSLVGLNITIKNHGDLPAYPYIVDVQIDNKESSGLLLPTVILPHQSNYGNCFFYINDISSGSHHFEIVLKDLLGYALANISYTDIPDENVSVVEYKWRYQENRQLKLPYPRFLYEYYSSQERLALEDFAAYVFDVYDDRYMDLVVEKFLALADTSDDVYLINFVTSFVQNLEYVEDDPGDLPYDNPRFPIEMLVDKQGDCEDKAILAAAILDNMVYNVSLLRLPNHMAVGVHLDENASSYDYYIEKYYFLETTGTRGFLGKVPEEYKDITNITVYPTFSRPILIHGWENATHLIGSDGSDFVKIKIIVENLGRETAYNFEIRGAFYSQNDVDFNQETTSISSLTAGDKKEVDLKVDVPKGIATTLKTQIYLNNKMVHEKESKDSFP